MNNPIKNLRQLIRQNKKLRKQLHGLALWILFESITISIGSTCTFLLVQTIAVKYFDHQLGENPIISLGMLLPMGILVATLSFSFSLYLIQYFLKLSHGLAQIADGHYDTLLDEDHAGPLREVYHDFNQMGRELKSVQALKEDFTNEFSHEFKTPLTSISGFAHLLLERDLPKEQREKYLQIIANEAERLTELTKNQLLLSNLEAQQLPPDKELYSLDEQIRNCVICLYPQCQEKNIDVSVELSPMAYYGNQELMQHVWQNLIGNAVKYTPEYGHITISSKETDSVYEISVSDTGIGMTEEEIQKIFQKYYQVKKEKSSKGLGLGLPIAAKIVELYNGRIFVSSIPGKGTVFTVTLTR